jgi:DNA-binding MarR family transcriptional regulator
LPAFVDTTVKDIDQRLRELQDEVSRLEAARSALTSGGRRPGRPRGATARTTGASARTTRARTGRRTSAGPRTRSTRRGGNTRAVQALDLVRKQPGATIPELAKAMKIEPNYLYRVLPRLASEGQVRRDGQGWHPALSSTSTQAEPTGNATGRRQARTAKAKPTASATRATGTRRGPGPTSTTNGRTPPGATKASVLAAFAGGESMTAGQVAAKAGLARPTVSTTLSKLAKTGEVAKAARGYRLTPAS